MKGVSREEMREIDRKAIEDYGILALVLMENAGLRSAELADKMLKRVEGNRVSLFCGKGNNGGDGLVCGRHLINKGYLVNIYLLGRIEEVKSEPVFTNLHILKKMDGEIREIFDLNSLLKFRDEIEESELIIDAIFGIGLSGEVKGYFRQITNFLNSLQKPVLSLDIPSGLDADSGLVLGTCIRASETITFAFPKKGLSLNDGPKYTGKLTVADISIPKTTKTERHREKQRLNL